MLKAVSASHKKCWGNAQSHVLLEHQQEDQSLSTSFGADQNDGGKLAGWVGEGGTGWGSDREWVDGVQEGADSAFSFTQRRPPDLPLSLQDLVVDILALLYWCRKQ